MGPNEKVNAIVEVVRDHAGDLVQVREIVAKASDGQRYPLPLGWCMLDVKVRGAAAPKEPMTYAGLGFKH